MKKVIAILLGLSLLFTFVACGSEKSDSQQDDSTVSSSSSKVESSSDTTSKNTESEKEWGVTESLAVDNNGTLCRVFVNFADYTGPTEATGRIASQNDGSIMIFDGQGILTTVQVPSGKVEDIFPTYFSQTEDIMESAYINKRKDFKFTIETKEVVTINGYEMCKVSGTHTYTPFRGDEVFSQKFVAYATFTKGNGAVVNWMVLDGTEDGSLANKLEDLGRKMAESFKEAE